MTENTFLNFLIGVCAVLILVLAWTVSKVDVANDCRTMGVTKIGSTVFECKEKNT